MLKVSSCFPKPLALWGKPGTETMLKKVERRGQAGRQPKGAGKGSPREHRVAWFLAIQGVFPSEVFGEDGNAKAERCFGCIVALHAGLNPLRRGCCAVLSLCRAKGGKGSGISPAEQAGMGC